MAEAACGPSNALSQFKQHQAVDRSLQQDRLTNRHLNRNPQNFRSANPNAAHLDADFEAFQAGFSPPVLDHGMPIHNQLLHHNNLPIQAPHQPQPQEAPSWANDFQQLHISSPNASSSNWAQGFQQHIAQNAPRAQSSVQSPLAFQQQARYGLTGFQSSFTPQQQFHNAAGLQSKGKEPVMAEQFDEAAFDRAFDMAREDMMADVEQEQGQEQPMQEDHDLESMIERVEAATQQEATNMLNDVAQEDERYWRPEDTIHGSDIEHQPFYEPVHDEQRVAQDEQRQNHDDDQLAATAEELLQKVSHDQSDKFKNSQFLSLMRRLRDREVRVEGDQMVETTAVSPTTATIIPPASSTTTTTTTPLMQSRNDNEYEFDHWESPYT